jgi:hypothetical protein
VTPAEVPPKAAGRGQAEEGQKATNPLCSINVLAVASADLLRSSSVIVTVLESGASAMPTAENPSANDWHIQFRGIFAYAY